MKQPLFMDKDIKNYHLSTKMPDFMDRLSKSPSCGKTGQDWGLQDIVSPSGKGWNELRRTLTCIRQVVSREPKPLQALLEG